MTFTNCQKDDNPDQENIKRSSLAQELPYLTSKKSFKEISENAVLMDQLKNIQNGNSDNHSLGKSSSKMVFLPIYDFYVDTDEANYLENLDGSYHSYTFPIYRLNTVESNLVQNLFLSLNVENGNFNTFIVSYYLNEDEREILANDNYIDLDGKISMEYLEDFTMDTLFESKFAMVDPITGVAICYEEGSGVSQGTGWSVIEYHEVPCPWDETLNTGGGGSASSNGSHHNNGIPDGYEGTDNDGDPQGGGGSGGSAATTNPNNPASSTNVNSALVERKKKFRRIQLTSEQNAWFSSQPTETQNAIISFLESQLFANGNSILTQYPQEAVDFMSLTINILMSYNETNFPGMELGYNYQWWLNDSFVDANFNFDVEGLGDLTAEEKRLVFLHPAEAIIIRENKQPAQSETDIRYGNNGINDKSDAFRHAYFNAMNSNDAGDRVARLFSTAHESEVTQNLILEKEMDLYNNSVGHNIGNNASFFVSDQELSNVVYQALLLGSLKYLFPINYTDPNFWDNPSTSNPNDGDHGITNSTQLILTNQ